MKNSNCLQFLSLKEEKEFKHQTSISRQLHSLEAGAEWPCLHLGNARWAGRVEVIIRVIFVCKTGDFLYFAKVGPVEWKLDWAGRLVVGYCPGQFSVPVRPCLEAAT